MKRNIELLNKLESTIDSKERNKVLEELIANNLGAIKQIAYKYSYTSLEVEDLIQEGSLGLLKAIETYEEDKERKFGNYARIWIAQYIRRATENQGSLIRLPSYIHEALTKAYLLNAEREAEGKPYMTTKELSDALNIEPSKFEEYIIAMIQPLSLDDCPDREEGLAFHETIPDPTAMIDLSSKELHERVELLLSLLSTRDQEVLKECYGINEVEEGRSMVDIGKELGISRQRVQQLRDKLLDSCRVRPRRLIFKGFLEG